MMTAKREHALSLLASILLLTLYLGSAVQGSLSSPQNPSFPSRQDSGALRGVLPSDGEGTPSPRRKQDEYDSGNGRVDDVCVAITGGAGQIAYALVPLIMQGGVLGEEGLRPGRRQRVRLRLLDIEPCVGVLEGVAMEIRDCFCDLVKEVVVTTDPKIAFQGADVAILLGGFPRLPGMERRDLIAKNVPIMAAHGEALAECAKPGVRVVVVANPACTNCLVASACAPSIPKEQFSSLSRLDHDRLSAALATELCGQSAHGGSVARSERPDDRERADVGAGGGSIQIRNVCVWGNHSPTMWPDVSKAEAKMPGKGWVSVEHLLGGGNPYPAHETSGVTSLRNGADALRAAGVERFSRDIVPIVRDRGNKVIEVRGKSSALSAANAIANHLRDWLGKSRSPATDWERGTRTAAEGRVTRVLSMGVSSDGNPYGVAEGLFFSFPVDCGEGRHRILDEFSPDKIMLEASEKELLEEKKEALDMLEELGLPRRV